MDVSCPFCSIFLDRNGFLKRQRHTGRVVCYPSMMQALCSTSIANFKAKKKKCVLRLVISSLHRQFATNATRQRATSAPAESLRTFCGLLFLPAANFEISNFISDFLAFQHILLCFQCFRLDFGLVEIVHLLHCWRFTRRISANLLDFVWNSPQNTIFWSFV